MSLVERAVFASGLDPALTTKELLSIFAKAGKVENVFACQDSTGESNGTAFAVFRDVKDAGRAVSTLNEDDLAVVHVKTRLLMLQLQLLAYEEDAEATISRLYGILTPQGKTATMS